MKAYVAHSKRINYIEELYQPLRKCEQLKDIELILPHEFQNNNSHTREFYKTLDLFIAEVSDSATGLGIELAFAYDDNIPIYCFHKEGTRVKNSIYSLTNNIFQYKNKEELTIMIAEIVNSNTRDNIKKH